MESDHLSIATFNTNSLRARLHIVIPWLEKNAVDVLCIQETKVQDKDFPAEPFKRIGYNVIYRGQKSYNGVAIASRYEIKDRFTGFDDPENSPEDEARLIRCMVKDIAIVNTYVPQGKALDNPYFQIKLRWFKRLRKLFERNYSPDMPMIWCGDLNVAPEAEDVYAPDQFMDHVCFHPDTRKALEEVKAWGFIDVFRRLNPEPGQYSFYDYRIPNAVKRHMGWRVDHIFATATLAEQVVKAYIDLAPRSAERPSDHTFLVAKFKRPG
ncbi:MAG: exodeoxyribonuclease III [Nitrospiraceae bacterium]|nr:exodeoxyribonuclease III [Nitrospiraceae bacterium]